MAEFPYFPLWTDAYLGDTRHLTTTEHGAYLLLLITAWRTPNCAIPNDDLFLRASAGNPKNWSTIKPRVLAFFTLGDDGMLSQKRQLCERIRVVNRHNKASLAANAKWLKEKKTAHAPASRKQTPSNAPPMPSRSISIDTPTPQEGHAQNSDGEEEKKMELRRRADGTNLRAMGENPRALQTNPRAEGTNPRAAIDVIAAEDNRWRGRLLAKPYRPGGFWPDNWGERPETGKNISIPAQILAEWKELQGSAT